MTASKESGVNPSDFIYGNMQKRFRNQILTQLKFDKIFGF